MLSKLFIRRPILASVLSIVIVMMGLGAMTGLPIAQYPEILPPEITVDATYPGASAEVIADTVAAPLEQQINGATDMIYMTSGSSSSGRVQIRVTFKTGTNPDNALVDVNNRVQAALPMLPEEVRRLGVNARKSVSSILGMIALSSPDGRYDSTYINNYALVNVVDEIKRVRGVGNAQLFSLSYYAMRIWLDPIRMNALGITPSDVAAALRSQNAQLPAGRIGSEPLDKPVDFTFTITTRGRLTTPEEFGQVIVRRDDAGGMVRIRDVARVELGAQDYSFRSTDNNRATVPIGVFLQPGANALETMDAVTARMRELSAAFPAGIQYTVPYDTTKFVRISIKEVVKTLFEAFVLVFLVVYVFLGNLRATLIPSLAVPVSLIGTFAGLYALGYSINTLTLFGMVLAIGIVVDDAIVVLENVERLMHEEHLSAEQATLEAMRQVTGPVIAIVLVLVSVFLPVAFLGGLSGVMYKQFAVTIAISVIISGIVALTLTPALCALLLRSEHRTQSAWFVRFNGWFARMTGRYSSGVALLLRRGTLALCLWLAVGVGAALMFRAVPGSLLPEEDQGLALAVAFLQDGASLSRSSEVAAQLDRFTATNPAIDSGIALIGFDLVSNSLKTNVVSKFISLKDWSQRGADQSVTAVAGQIMGFGATQVRDAAVMAFVPPAIIGLSTTGGFELYLQSRSSADYRKLAAVAGQFVAKANQDPRLARVQTAFSANTPQISAEIDRDKAAQMGVSLTDLFESTQATFGSLYVNDFNRDGRTYQVLLQADGAARSTIDDLRNVAVRATSGELVPLTTLVRPVQQVGPELVDRFNGFPAIKVMGNPAPGQSSGAAIAALEQVAAQVLPPGYTISWSGQAYQEKLAGRTALIAFVAGLLMVFLILSAQYERWSLPVAVIMSVPFAILGALIAVFLRGTANDIYFQVGLVTLIGLSAKNAILIVEFAAQNVRAGMSVADSALLAARQRFRPIVMTSLAFILGVLPLAISSGAGSAARHSIGTGVIGGMLASTLIAVIFIPTFFAWVAGRKESGTPRPSEPRLIEEDTL